MGSQNKLLLIFPKLWPPADSCTMFGILSHVPLVMVTFIAMESIIDPKYNGMVWSDHTLVFTYHYATDFEKSTASSPALKAS